MLVRLRRDGTATWDNLIEAAALQRDKARFVEYLRPRGRHKATEGGGRKGGKQEEDIASPARPSISSSPRPQSLSSFRLPPSALRLCMSWSFA